VEPESQSARYRLAVVAIRPQPYHSALFRLLAAHPRIDLTVYYLFQEGLGTARDLDYGRFEWRATAASSPTTAPCVLRMGALPVLSTPSS